MNRSRAHTPRLTAENWARGLTFLLDSLALSALALTQEVSLVVFAFPAALLFIRNIFRFSLPIHVLSFFFLPVFAGAVYYWLGMKNPAVVSAASAVPFVHALLWFAPRSATYRGWRIGIGFVELILSSGLTADAYLPAFISIFVVITSVALSCDFMDRELAKRAPEERKRFLGNSFIRNSAGLSVLIFLTAALIFPILPRPRTALNIGQSLTPGYTESVDVKRWSPMDHSSLGSVQLRLYPPPGVDLGEEIYLGLIRTRILDGFDGGQWYPSSQRVGLHRRELTASRRGALRVEAIREPMSTDALPVPYGTFAVSDAFPTQSGEWLRSDLINRRSQYTIELVPNQLSRNKVDPLADAPREVHLRVPESIHTERLERLARSIFGSAQGTPARVQKLREYFVREGFSTQESSDFDPTALDRQLRKLKLNPIEEFLLSRKQGHCEWFSTSSAVLLRLAHIPTRLVAGFRVTTSQIGGVLTLRSSDAHAWVEVYYPERGWLPFDPTPRAGGTFGLIERARALTDLLGGYWYKYVVSYGDLGSEGDSTSRRSLVQDFAPRAIQLTQAGKELGEVWLFGLVGILLLVPSLLFFFRPKGMNQGPPALNRERKRIARILRVPDLNPSLAKPATLSPKAQARWKIWREIYIRARFGPEIQKDGATQEAVAVLKKISNEIRSAN